MRVPLVNMGMSRLVLRMAVVVRVAVAGIGAANRIELSLHLFDMSPEAFEHRLDDVIAQDQDAAGFDGRGKVAVADVPGEFRDVNRIATADRIERLLGRCDLDDAARFNHESIAGGQNHRFRQIDQNFAAIGQPDHASAQVALIMLKNSPAKRRLTA